MPDDEINRMLSVVDTISQPADTVTLGPFSVFHSQVKASRSVFQEEFTINSIVTGSAIPNQEQGAIFSDILKGCTENTYPFENEISHESSHADSDIMAWPVPVDDIFQVDNNDQYSILATMYGQSGYSSAFLKTSLVKNPQLLRTRVPRLIEISMSLFSVRDTSMLMYHYMNHVSELLQPVLHPGNPWKTTYFKFALEGCPELAVADTPSSSSKVSTAIFHSVLSSAAFHLRNATNDPKRFHKLGLQHRAKSLQALNAALTGPIKSNMYTINLTAMLSLVTIDTMTGEDEDFLVHLDGCQQLQALDGKVLDGSTQQIRSICHFLTLLARTTSHKLHRQSSRKKDHCSETPFFHENDTGVEYMYGITPTLGNLLQRTCHLAETMSLHQDKSLPLELHEACQLLENDITRWKLDPAQFHKLGSSAIAVEVAYCQARAFHSAVLIYYYRTVKLENHADMEKEVNKIWTNLKAAEDLKDQYLGGEKRTAPMSWPAFIAACESCDRKPWIYWWERVQGYKIGNFRRQWIIIQQLWEIMDKEDSVAHWKEALERSGILVLPI
ncbi:hypothetical protein N7462_001421 [Penicillium macrosclerotiorum]|uniref:uncharacterized protein n=1 Tax=Penicillium macrosclerotiorum TaxID=303699 RepID=UPI00254754F0|nr:uncharacterized protein N7462_001421 [Penicillium macrosclerotiorum]KAJ5691998.1 hypothetical protein N7462_001421 [Penicillium macrosclerotiorum]